MNEKLLQFIWQFRYFNSSFLQTTDGRHLQIIQAGMLNHNAGPDFSEAKIKVDDTIWVGNVELHVKASDWLLHDHSSDKNYHNIILHIVWINDKILYDHNHQPITTLELQPLVPKIILQRFEKLMLTGDAIPCAFALPVLNDIEWLSWKERLIAERLTEKSNLVNDWLRQSKNNWEEVFWISLSRSFGMKVNAATFEMLAKSLPVKILARHKNQIHQLEALLLGQAGLLNEIFDDSYAVMLQKEYFFLSKKYALQPIKKQPAFLRMRPYNFPTLRLAQLAMLVNHSHHLFSNIKSVKKVNEIFQWFDIMPNDFWNYHFTLTDKAVLQTKPISKSFIQHIIINAVTPVLFAYAIHKNENEVKEKVIQFLIDLQPELNTITSQWKSFNVANKNAMDSQALIHLKNKYCIAKKCLECAVGVKLLKK
ncbi:MAG: DUF2851 family protein [Bacteroidetes bacterium]|nr:DUF2851 family protein [Bacteroidota bacterium]